ncbi:helix-turn-helix domain-containing protein [Cetobacterium sp. SF1]|uniref:helix-turn-helix domain-containing protein n=1 Tax=Cetobacterium sp. SF1 TaxID=3417654 RepID=UPI003CEA55EE
MFLNKRSLDIIKILTTVDNISINKLEELLNVKKRTIINNIDIINEFLKKNSLKEIIIKDQYLFINSLEHDSIKNLISFVPLSSEERMDYLLIKLLINNKIVLQHEANILGISRRSLNYDLDKLKLTLSNLEIELYSVPQQGIYLKGNESVIRNIFVEYLTKYFIEGKNYLDIHKNLIEFNFNEEKISQTKKLFMNFIDKLNFTIPPEDFYFFMSIYLVSAFRQNITNTYDLNILQDFELSHINNILTYINPNEFDFNSKYCIIANSFIKELELLLDTKLKITKEFLIKITNGLRLGIFKAKMKINEKVIENPFENNSNFIFEIVNETLKKKEIYLRNEDILFLAIVVKESLDEFIIYKNLKKNILIIDNSFNFLYGKLLKRYLNTIYNVNIIDIITEYQSELIISSIKKIDCLISLEEINLFEEIPLIKINLNDLWNSTHILEKYGIVRKYISK